MGICDPTTCVYQFIYNESDNYAQKVQYFNMHGLGVRTLVDSYVTHMLYAWSPSHNK